MKDAVAIALISSIPATLAGLGSLIASLRNSQKLKEIHESTNGLLAQGRSDSHKQGMSDQREQDRASKAP